MSLAHDVQRARLTLSRVGEPDLVTYRMRRMLKVRPVARALLQVRDAPMTYSQLDVVLHGVLDPYQLAENLGFPRGTIADLRFSRKYRYMLVFNVVVPHDYALPATPQLRRCSVDLPKFFSHDPARCTLIMLTQMHRQIRRALQAIHQATRQEVGQ